MNIELSFRFHTHVCQGLQGKFRAELRPLHSSWHFLVWPGPFLQFFSEECSSFFPFPTKTSMGLFSAQLHVLLALRTQSPGSKGSCFKPSKNPSRLSSSLLCFNWPFEKREGLGEDSALVSRKPHEYLL